jgi:hypothetical protein
MKRSNNDSNSFRSRAMAWSFFRQGIKLNMGTFFRNADRCLSSKPRLPVAGRGPAARSIRLCGLFLPRSATLYRKHYAEAVSAGACNERGIPSRAGKGICERLRA